MSSKANIAAVHTDFRLYWPSRLVALGEAVASRGGKLSVIEVAGKGSPYSFDATSGKDSGIAWTQLFENRPMEEIEASEAVSGIMDRLDALDPDVVLAGSIAFPSGAAATRWCTKHRRPLVVFDDARLDDVPRPGYVDWVKRQVYSHVDAIVVPAPSHDATYRHFGFAAERLFHGVNAVDNAFFGSGRATPVENLPPSPFLLCVGRQIPIKNCALLLKAFMAIAEQPESRAWNLVFVGEGTEHDTLTKLAGALHGKRVHFVPFNSQEKLSWYYQAASAMVLPSLRETWGLVVNEAMAAGLPVLVSNRCGCAETLVHDGENGFVFDPERIESISESLLKFFALDRAKRSVMAERSRAIVADWGLERFCQGMLAASGYVQSHGKRKGSLAGRIIMEFWNGRYRPV
ncbi:MAG: glycosyltransferase family 4 protein [Chlorobiaceae bacterium]|nr:glycosyltransferase family 4 protein [Chlorobiaceae bacterium]